MRLFGHARAGLCHDIPGHIEGLVSRTSGRLGTAAEILLTRTVLGYYMRFRPAEQAHQIINHLAAASTMGLKSQLGWPATRMGAAHPLRACDECLAEDIAVHGTPTWRVFHQLPGVWVCPVHRCALWTNSVRAEGLHRFQWLLPDEVPKSARHLADVAHWSTEAQACAAMVADATACLADGALSAPLDPNSIGATLMSRLVERGFATTSGRLRAGALSEAFAQSLSTFHDFPEASAMCLGQRAAICSLRRMLEPHARAIHPLRYIAAVRWLYESWSEFISAYEAYELGRSFPERSTSLPTARATGALDERKTRFLTALRKDGRTISSAAREVKIDVQTGMLWAANAGMPVRRRPKKLDESTRKAVVRGLEKGQPKARLAVRHQLSVVTITRVLLSELSLRKLRQQRIFELAQSRARSQISRFLARSPQAGVKTLSKAHPAAFAWLYRHDRAWLQSATTAHHAARSSGPPRVNWGDRDAEFAAGVKAVIARTATHTLDKTLRVSDLVRAVPGLRRKIDHLPQMPQTRALLLQFQSASTATNLGARGH